MNIFSDETVSKKKKKQPKDKSTKKGTDFMEYAKKKVYKLKGCSNRSAK